jgi:hypothetical protein
LDLAQEVENLGSETPLLNIYGDQHLQEISDQNSITKDIVDNPIPNISISPVYNLLTNSDSQHHRNFSEKSIHSNEESKQRMPVISIPIVERSIKELKEHSKFI